MLPNIAASIYHLSDVFQVNIKLYYLQYADTIPTPLPAWMAPSPLPELPGETVSAPRLELIATSSAQMNRKASQAVWFVKSALFLW